MYKGCSGIENFFFFHDCFSCSNLVTEGTVLVDIPEKIISKKREICSGFPCPYYGLLFYIAHLNIFFQKWFTQGPKVHMICSAATKFFTRWLKLLSWRKPCQIMFSDMITWDLTYVQFLVFFFLLCLFILLLTDSCTGQIILGTAWWEICCKW